ncbi:MAG: 5-formaminoimidazole-4-carboxamide-(beta)-D-ribofuranosyl 5-monophosphate synthetase-like protein [Candidatus Saccharibacteria bacterium]|nr:5-formaminoimidazole-4-carboxamide-(beta)-D-ribofuranosyl 5-monophosphate synthetase-like protein [Candidatus Saccharibacteria bacterium]
MIGSSDIAEILKGYDKGAIRIASLGGHSALDVCRGAKAEGFETVVVAQKGREQTYQKYYKTRKDGRGCVDHVIVVDNFKDVSKPEIQQQLRDLNVVFVHSRYFWVYCDFDEIENNFKVPIFGTRQLVRKEERDEEKNQYFLLQQGGVPIPIQFDDPKKIDRLVIVKTNEASRGYERAFFLVNNFAEYKARGAEMIAAGTITEASLRSAVIEEFIVGPQLNMNYFYSPLTGELELLGTDTRRQTNLDGLLRLTAPEQTEVLKHVEPKYIENGHQSVTIKESLLEQAFVIGEKFVASTKQHYDPGIIGPFALQGAFTAGPPKEEFKVFDVSMRIPGSPGTMFTPYTGYLHGESISTGRRIAQEIKQAIATDQLARVLT